MMRLSVSLALLLCRFCAENVERDIRSVADGTAGELARVPRSATLRKAMELTQLPRLVVGVRRRP